MECWDCDVGSQRDDTDTSSWMAITTQSIGSTTPRTGDTQAPRMAGAVGGTSPSQNSLPAGLVDSKHNAAAPQNHDLRKREQVEMALGASAVASSGSGPSQVTCIPPVKSPRLEPKAAGIRSDAQQSDLIQQQLLESCIRQAKEVKACTGKKCFPFDFETLTTLRKSKVFEAKFTEHLITRIFRFTHHLRGTGEFGP